MPSGVGCWSPPPPPQWSLCHGDVSAALTSPSAGQPDAASAGSEAAVAPGDVDGTTAGREADGATLADGTGTAADVTSCVVAVPGSSDGSAPVLAVVCGVRPATAVIGKVCADVVTGPAVIVIVVAGPAVIVIAGPAVIVVTGPTVIVVPLSIPCGTVVGMATDDGTDDGTDAGPGGATHDSDR